MTEPTGSGLPPADLHTLTGAYALDALDDVERRAFERHLAQCEACAEEVLGFRETAARLADGVGSAPSPQLRDRVLAQVRATPQLPPLQRVPDVAPGADAGAPAGDRPAGGGPARPAGRRVRRPAPGGRSGLLVAAAAAVVLALGGGAFGLVQYRAAQDLREQQQVALAQQREVASVVGDPAVRLVSGPVATGGRVTLAVAGGRAAVLTSGVTALPADRTYQLWVVRADGIRSLGLGPAASAAAGSWQRPVAGVRAGDTVAVSVEPLGGSQQPTTTPVAAVKV